MCYISVRGWKRIWGNHLAKYLHSKSPKSLGSVFNGGNGEIVPTIIFQRRTIKLPGFFSHHWSSMVISQHSIGGNIFRSPWWVQKPKKAGRNHEKMRISDWIMIWFFFWEGGATARVSTVKLETYLFFPAICWVSILVAIQFLAASRHEVMGHGTGQFWEGQAPVKEA